MLSYLARGVVRMILPSTNTENVPVIMTDTTQVRFVQESESDRGRPEIVIRFDNHEVNGKTYENTLTATAKFIISI